MKIAVFSAVSAAVPVPPDRPNGRKNRDSHEMSVMIKKSGACHEHNFKIEKKQGQLEEKGR